MKKIEGKMLLAMAYRRHRNDAVFSFQLQEASTRFPLAMSLVLMGAGVDDDDCSVGFCRLLQAPSTAKKKTWP